ncbi:MAG TPA: apolipoprotein N-acyltransferase [Actinomycetota bacterium]|nr:apolipoprotein N-acyltransferase [Actinomycetota bacterium]
MTPNDWPLKGRLVAAAVSGLALSAAFPPLDQRWVALIALVPLFLALRGASARAGALLGLVIGAAFFGVLLYWISYFGYAAFIALVVLETAFFVVFGALGARASRTMPGRILGVPLLWAGLEIARARYPLGGFSWGVIGYTQHSGGSMLPLARVGGVVLLGLAIVLVNALIAEALTSRPAGIAALALAIGAVVLLPGLLPLGLAGRAAGTFDVAAVQGNVPRDRFTGLGRRGRVGPEDFTIVNNHVRETQLLFNEPKPDLIVWPENSFDRDPRTNPDMVAPVVATIQRIGAPLLAGAILDEGDRWTNTNVLIGPTGQIVQRYDKIHLVPFGEYVPWHFVRSLVPALDREVPSDAIAGKKLVVFHIDGARIGTLICFESTYPELARGLARDGAQLLIVTTNNASFGTSPAAREHLAMSQMRAVETGRAVVHAAISGISAVIQPNGKITQESKLFTPALLRANLPLATGETPYARFGSDFEIAIGAGALMFALLPFFARKPKGES